LFRFPLRCTQSDISDRDYTPAQVLHLFERLRAEEADCLLLFLPGLSKLRLDHIDRLGARRTVVSIAVSEPARGADAERRQNLYNQAISYVGQDSVSASGDGNSGLSFQELKVYVCSGGQESAATSTTKWLLCSGVSNVDDKLTT
jgi:hypothetical protein